MDSGDDDESCDSCGLAERSGSGACDCGSGADEKNGCSVS
jgi:hypothetical protein